MSLFKFVFVALFCLSFSRGALAQSPDAIARCQAQPCHSAQCPAAADTASAQRTACREIIAERVGSAARAARATVGSAWRHPGTERADRRGAYQAQARRH